MTGPLHFYFDLASPYAWFAFDQVGEIARDAGRTVEYRPILMWAVLKAHGIAPPMDAAVKRRYFLHDMQRSATFHGVEYKQPAKLPLSSHLASRLCHVALRTNADLGRDLSRRILRAFFAEGQDISREDVIATIAVELGMSQAEARDAMSGATGRALLEAAVTEAIEREVVGSPFILVDGEGFFGVDRLPQLDWFLKRRVV